MELLYLLEKIRNPVLDFFFSAITILGEETTFLVLAIFIFWCVDKKYGYFVMMTGFIGTLLNQIMKLVFAVPRPWVIDTNFEPVAAAKPAATGYSFPSGHTQSAVGSFGAVFAGCRVGIIKWTALAIAVLVPFSRMYLGVHTPWDVMAGAAMSIILLLMLYPVFTNEKRFKRFMPWLIILVTLIAIGFYSYTVYINKEFGNECVDSARKNARTFMGCTLALIPVYLLDRFLIRFDTKAKWYAQIMKLVIGLGIVIAIKSLLKAPLATFLGEDDERIIRYFLIVLFAGAIWPATFPLFAKIKIAPLDRLGERVASRFGSSASDYADLSDDASSTFTSDNETDASFVNEVEQPAVTELTDDTDVGNDADTDLSDESESEASADGEASED